MEGTENKTFESKKSFCTKTYNLIIMEGNGKFSHKQTTTIGSHSQHTYYTETLSQLV